MGIKSDHHHEFKKERVLLSKEKVERVEQEPEDFINLNVHKFALPRIMPSKVDREYSYANFQIVPKEKFAKRPEDELFRRRLLNLWKFAVRSALEWLKKRKKPLTRKKSEKEKERERKREQRRLKRKNKFRDYL